MEICPEVPTAVSALADSKEVQSFHFLFQIIKQSQRGIVHDLVQIAKRSQSPWTLTLSLCTDSVHGLHHRLYALTLTPSGRERVRRIADGARVILEED